MKSKTLLFAAILLVIALTSSVNSAPAIGRVSFSTPVDMVGTPTDELSVTLYNTTLFIGQGIASLTVVSIKNAGSSQKSLTLPNGARVNQFFIAVNALTSYSLRYVGSILYLDENGHYVVYRSAPTSPTQTTAEYRYPSGESSAMFVNFTPTLTATTRSIPVKIRFTSGIWRSNYYQLSIAVYDGQTPPVGNTISKLGLWSFFVANNQLSSEYDYFADVSPAAFYAQGLRLTSGYQSPSGVYFRNQSVNKVSIYGALSWPWQFNFTCVDSDGNSTYNKGEVGVVHPDGKYISLIKDACFSLNGKSYLKEGVCMPAQSTIFPRTNYIECRNGCNEDYTGCRVPSIVAR